MKPLNPSLLDVSEASAKRRAASLVGTTISERYRIVELLAMGGMGAVFRGEHVLMKKRIAIKILHPEVDKRRDLVKRFEREAIAGAHIQHPNVASATDFGKLEDGSYFLVLEYVRGKTLHDMSKAGAIGVRRAFRIARQLAAALAASHAKGILHRDVKPRNIMVVEEEDDLTKLIDFGLAKVSAERLSMLEDDTGDRVTDVGTVFGTVAYMAPEAAHGMQAVEARSDLYALGIIFYEMLAGKHPFDGENPIELFRAQRFDNPPPFAERAPARRVPGVVEAIVMRLLEKDPGARYASAQLLGEAMDAAMPSIEAFAPEPAEPSLDTAELGVADLQAVAPREARDARPFPSFPPGRLPSIPSMPSVGAERVPSIPPDAAVPSFPEAPLDVEPSEAPPPGRAPDPYAVGSFGGPTIRMPSIPPAPEPRPRRLTAVRVGLVAASVALCVGLGWVLGSRSPEAPSPAPRASAPPPAVAPADVASALPVASSSAPNEAPPTTPAASLASPPASAAPESSALAGPSSSAAGPPFDPVAWRALLRKSATKGDWTNGQLALLTLADRAPESFHEPAIAAATREVATALAHSGNEGADRVFDALAHRLGSDGLDILYELVAERGGSIGAKRAEVILSRKESLARMSPELHIAYLLRVAPCDGKLALLDRAAAQGDARALLVLQTSGVACFKRNRAVEDAIRSLRQKLAKR